MIDQVSNVGLSDSKAPFLDAVLLLLVESILALTQVQTQKWHLTSNTRTMSAEVMSTLESLCGTSKLQKKARQFGCSKNGMQEALWPRREVQRGRREDSAGAGCEGCELPCRTFPVKMGNCPFQSPLGIVAEPGDYCRVSECTGLNADFQKG